MGALINGKRLFEALRLLEEIRYVALDVDCYGKKTEKQGLSR